MDAVRKMLDWILDKVDSIKLYKDHEGAYYAEVFVTRHDELRVYKSSSLFGIVAEVITDLHRR